ncbi:hypothetical protein [Streptomyces sp. NPDC020298]|uniref:hypothetical protein n=1 Tax=unclassified Streptomyces TaxID=2593676 RepID=UPI0033E182BE
MGTGRWRTGRWGTALWRTAVRFAVTGALTGAAVALPGGTAVADGTTTGTPGGTPSGYAFAPKARTVQGTAGTTDAEPLEPGETYRSSLGKNAEVYYRLALKDRATAYVAVTAVPPSDAKVAATDGIRVSLQDGDGNACSNDSAGFGGGLSPQPVTALGTREAGKALCQGAGTFYLVVERVDATGSGAGSGAGGASSAQDWSLEIAPVTEPPRAKAAGTAAPEAWNSATPEPLTGDPGTRTGTAGFAGAQALDQGVWDTRIRPGQTLFYKVPVDWGQQLYATAELGSSTGKGGYVTSALDLALYNPARGDVTDVPRSYNGRQTTVTLAPLPPVEYDNRYAPSGQVSAMRFAGNYYLAVHLSGQVADTFGDKAFGLTLRVRVDGTPHAGPGYTGKSAPANLFEITDGDREAAATGVAPGGGTAMKALAAGGIGTGTVLLLGLGLWTLTARRRASAAEAAEAAEAQMRVSAQNPTA